MTATGEIVLFSPRLMYWESMNMVTKRIEAIQTHQADVMLASAYGRRSMSQPVPEFRLPEHELVPDTAYRIVHDEPMLDDNSRLEYIPMEKGCYVTTPDEVLSRTDENTIGVVVILGTTFTGEFEPIEIIQDALVKQNTDTGWQIPMHIERASGGFVAPFSYPDLKWNSRLASVKSINASGHKYSLVYLGIGWMLWRAQQDLPEDLIFHINYPGDGFSADMADMLLDDIRKAVEHFESLSEYSPKAQASVFAH
ncbi:MAG: hypothetical protein N838_18740 [Thiohalocapsa sp. PB-PSB1]|jgi:glutamate/tyrosine decarboxylase-like PLP-dependent enzyme|nr:MAG: hypothetical protein N838_18740 [Thiohalocapsa sp. PB-PSB1]